MHDIKIEQEKNKTLTVQLNELEELISKLQKEIDTKTEQIKTLEQKKEENNEENNQLDFLRKQKEFFQKENHKFKEEIFQLNNTVTTLQEANKKLKEDYFNYQEESKVNSTILQEEYQKLQKEISSLKNQPQLSPISPQTHQIIANKAHDKLTWYLLKLKEPLSNSPPYNVFTWIPHPQIEQTLKQYNTFVSEEEFQANLIQSYLLKAEKREEVISQLTYKVQKLTELSGISLSNSGIVTQKTSKSRQSDNAITISQENIDLAILNKTNPTIMNTNKKTSQIDSNALMVKYNNSLLKIAELEEQITKYQKIILKSKLTEKDSSRTITEESKSDNKENTINENKVMETLIKLQEENNSKEKLLELVKKDFRELQVRTKGICDEAKRIIGNIKIASGIKDSVKRILKMMNYTDENINLVLKDGSQKKKVLGLG